METELTQVAANVPENQKLDPNLVAKSTQEIEQMIAAEGSNKGAEQAVTPAAEVVVKAEGTEATPAEQIPATVQPPATPPIQPVTEQPKVDEVKAFLEKKHLVGDPQWIAKTVEMYSNAEKELSRKSQELAALKKQEVPQAVQTVTPVSNGDLPPELQQQLLEDLQRNPDKTLERYVVAKIGPILRNLEGQYKNQQLHNTVVSLSTSPDTAAEFNLPIVQEEIKKVIEENPYMVSDIPKYMPSAFDTAVGRLYRQGKLNKDAVGAGIKMAEQRTVTPGASIPASSKPPTPVAEKPLSEMTPSELEQLMAKMKVM